MESDFEVGRSKMKTPGVVLLCLLLLLGCALPVPLRIASWASDGFSLLATDKSIADHGISVVARRDCALWRGLSGEKICD
jgi:hypothetical protein